MYLLFVNILRNLWEETSLKRKQLTGVLLVIFMLFSVFTLSTNAEREGYYYVRAEIPENQINKKNSYFDLLVEPGQSQTIQISIFNTSDEDIVVNVSVNNAATNTNGTIMYTTQGIKDESADLSIEEIVHVKEKQFMLSGNDSTIIEIDIMLPEKEFLGTILGGIVIQASQIGVEEEAKENTIEIKNKLTYVVGLQLRQNLDKKIIPNINYLGTKAVLHDISSAVGIQVQNSEAMIMKNVVVNAEIYKKNSTKLLHEYHNTAVEIAPNSSFDIAVVWGNERLQAGEYRLKLQIQFEEYEWHWDEEFVIETDSIKEINEQAINIDRSIPKWVYYGIAVIVLMILLLLAFLLGRVSKTKKK